MFHLDQSGITKSRLGYLFSYEQMAFNQLRRHANLIQAKELADAENEKLNARLRTATEPLTSEEIPLGWRTFTLEHELEAEELEVRILAVLSTALFLEAYIYDYCARKESDTFSKKYIDKLDPVAKWVIVPALITPPGLTRSDDVFERMGKLFALRNELVHHKTKSAKSFSLPPEFPEGLEPVDCIKLICNVLEKLIALDPGDEFATFVLRHIGSWFKYAAKDSRFYPILWEA